MMDITALVVPRNLCNPRTSPSTYSVFRHPVSELGSVLNSFVVLLTSRIKTHDIWDADTRLSQGSRSDRESSMRVGAEVLSPVVIDTQRIQRIVYACFNRSRPMHCGGRTLNFNLNSCWRS